MINADISLPFAEEEIEQSIIDRWERIVKQFYDKVAVTTFSGETFTYADLDRDSNRLAVKLIDLLGEENVPVLLLLDHSYDLIVHIFGALKAHKAYVALDPNQPVKQLKLLSDQTGASVLVTTQALAEKGETIVAGQANGSAVPGTTTLYIDELPDADVAPKITIPADSVAGLFFTSGSISVPKGVPRNHRTVLHRVWYGTSVNRFKPGDKISGMRQCGLGSGVADLFNALLNGATYCLYFFKKQGLNELSGWLREQQISYFHPPIVAFRQWLDTLEKGEQFPHLRQILPSGRKRIEDIERVWPHVSDDCVVLTSYSSTETTQICCSVLTKQTELTNDVLDVGVPLPGKQITLIGEDGETLSVGEVGELVIQSRFIATGYWNRPELTAERFSLAPDGSSETVYRTGDFGRLRADGQIALVGRKDSQIKIRGYRVVLDEVEDALRQLPQIKETAVTFDSKLERLNAYITVVTDPAPTQGAIRSALAHRFPEYALPSNYIFLDRFPTLPSGKINRHLLPEPGKFRPNLDTAFAPPTGDIEQKIAQSWEELFDLAGLGIYDNFFELGGHSLMASRLVSRLQIAFEFGLPISWLFEGPTIHDLADQVETVLWHLEPDPADAFAGEEGEL